MSPALHPFFRRVSACGAKARGSTQKVAVTNSHLPSRKEFHRKLQRLGAVVSVISSLAVIAFAVPLLDLTPEQFKYLAMFMVLSTVAISGPILFLESRACRPIDHYLDAFFAGPIEDSIRHTAFSAVFLIPRKLARNACVGSIVCGLASSVLLYSTFETVTLFTAGVALASTCTSGMLSLLLIFLGMQRILEPIRDQLAQEIADTELRESLVRSLPLRRKILIAVGSLVFASVVFGVCLAQVRGTKAIEAFIFGQHEQIFNDFEQQRQALGSLEAARDATQSSLLDTKMRLTFFSANTPNPNASTSAHTTELSPQEIPPSDSLIAAETLRLLRRHARSQSQGNSNDLPSVNPVSWRKVSDDTLLVVATSAETYGRGVTQLRIDFFAIIGIAVAVSLLIAHFAFRNLEESIFALGAEMLRIASGDLRRGTPHESEDEIGGLGRTLEKMSQALRITLGKTVAAVDQVDETATQISDATARIAAATLHQSAGLRDATQITTNLREQIQQITQSTGTLDRSVDTASRSSLQLSKSSRQLRDDSLLFSHRIDAISSTIEVIAQSIRAINQHTEATLELATDVTTKAQQGHAEIQSTQTVVEDIHESYQATALSIRDLHQRALEIGSILEVIRLVSEQTMMLGLNAAVIAARSGEHAISFGVVAAEMQTLSTQVAERTKEIESIITKLQKDSKTVSEALKKENTNLRSAVQYSIASAQAFERIADAAQTSGERFAEIAAAIQTQTKNSAAVLGNTNQLRMLALQVRDTTDDQSKNTAHIAKTIEAIQIATRSIFEALQQQKTQCAQATNALERVLADTAHNEDFVEQVSGVIQRLEFQSKELREKITLFQIADSESCIHAALHTPKSFRSAFLWELVKTSSIAVLLILLFVVPLVHLAEKQWHALAWALLALIGLQTAFNMRLQNRWIAPILRYLEESEHITAASRSAREAAFQAAMHLPLRLALLGTASYSYTGVALGTVIYFASELSSRLDAVIFAIGTALGGILTQVFIFAGVSNFLAPYRKRLASEIHDTDLRTGLIPHFTLRKKIIGLVGGLVLVSATFAIFMAHRLAQESIEQYVIAQEEQSLDLATHTFRRHGDVALTLARVQQTPLAKPMQWLHTSATELAKPGATLPGLLNEEVRILANQAATQSAGNSSRLHLPTPFAWKKLGSADDILIVITPSSVLHKKTSTLQTSFFLLIALVLGVALFIAYRASIEMERSVHALRARLQRIADGNFLRGIPLEAEDEFGELGRIIDRMAHTLRQTIQSVATAATRVDETTNLIKTATQQIHTATSAQGQGIQSAHHAVQRVHAEVQNIAGSTASLNEAISTSIGPVQQLSVASNQLRALADFFSQSADEVSAAIQATAASIRSADANAMEARELAQAVMTNVEQGEVHVAQSIQAMQRIEKTTDAARQITSQLTDRARDIDAMLGVIRNIADQTTMLGLNAAVLADRGGLEGKAFGVVAEEMQNLSKKVALRAREIERQIFVLKEGSCSALTAIEHTLQGITHGARGSQATGDTLAAIEEASALSTQRIAEIEVALTQQRTKTETVWNDAVAMEQLAATIYSTAGEQSASSRDISSGIETARTAVAAIHDALQAQMQQCRDTTSTLDALVGKTQSNTTLVQNILSVVTRLSEEARSLRREIDHFKFREETHE